MNVGETSMADSNTVTGYFSPEGAAAYLSCSRELIFKKIRLRELPSFKIGKLRRIARADLDAMVERLRAETVAVGVA
jgi:excisionase family DNA binding protein